MSQRIKTVVIDLGVPLQPILVDATEHAVRCLVRWQGTPLGSIQLPVSQGECSVEALSAAIAHDCSWALMRAMVAQQLANPSRDRTGIERWEFANLIQPVSSDRVTSWPTLTVVVCATSETQSEMADCLAAIAQLDYPALDILVMSEEGADSSSAPDSQVRYIQPVNLSLNHQRNLAIAAASGSLVAFIDPQVRVDPGWAKAVAIAFEGNPQVNVLTGLVITDDITTEAQYWFEQGYSLSRGLERQFHRLDLTQPVDWPTLGTMQCGSEVNFAVRREAMQALGGFSPDMPGAGGHLDLFARVLLAGQTLLYEPTAVVRYRAPQTEADLRSRITNSIQGIAHYLKIGQCTFPSLKRQWLTLGVWQAANLLRNALRSGGVLAELAKLELKAFWEAGRQDLGGQVTPIALPKPERKSMAVRTLDVSQPIADLTDVAAYSRVRIFVTHGDVPLGSFDLKNAYQSIGAGELCHQLATNLLNPILAIAHDYQTDRAWTETDQAVKRYLLPPVTEKIPTPPKPFPTSVPVTVIVPTCDRPTDLTDCLTHLLAQITDRPVEIIVADNRPASGITAPIVAQFPGVKRIEEPRAGASYCRNAAIAASTGEIIVTIDDDVMVPPDWLEKLLVPLNRPEVMVVTGNVLPWELETEAQIMFEDVKGGLGQGFKSFEVDGNWLASFSYLPPIWDLGVSANAAFRASLFAEPTIGLMDEVLGPGTPTGGGGEENHLIYKILRAGHTLVYEPKAYVWHRHRREMQAFYRQVRGHMKGGTAYQLLLWLQEGELRAPQQIFVELPRYFLKRVYGRLRGYHQTPWPLLWCEISGFLSAFGGYWQSVQRVKRLGRSAPYIPVNQRSLLPESVPILSLTEAKAGELVSDEPVLSSQS